ncbi:MAG: alpha/beta fold hydrolase [Deltaproteobacteria bacterium]
MADAVKLHYSEAGTGTPLVLLHGFPLSSEIWRVQRAGLNQRWRVITPDLRGHGKSPAPEGMYEMEAMARDVLALLDSLRIAKAVIMGHSMGGYVTLAAAKIAPERFLGLGLIASQAAADTEEARQGRFKLIEKVAAEGSGAVAAAMIPRLFAPRGGVGNDVIEEVRQMILKTPRAGIVGALQGMAARENTEAVLAKLTVPVLLLAGEHDQIIPPAKSQALAAAVSRATLAIVENAGHMPMLENPAETTAAIGEFLSKTVEGVEESKGSKGK